MEIPIKKAALRVAFFLIKAYLLITELEPEGLLRCIIFEFGKY